MHLVNTKERMILQDVSYKEIKDFFSRVETKMLKDLVIIFDDRHAQEYLKDQILINAKK